MTRQWYYSQDGAQYGPVDEAEVFRQIQSGELPPGTPVLKKGSMDWKPARDHVCFQVEIYPKRRVPSKVVAMTAPGHATESPASSKGQSSVIPAATRAVPTIPEVPMYPVEQKLVWPWIVGGLFLAAFLLIGLPRLGVYPSPFSALFGDGYRSNTTDQIKFDDKSFKIERDPKNKSMYYLTGLVRNTSDETFEQVELRFILYDASGMKLGKTLDFTNKLSPNMEWHFRAVSMFTNVALVDLAGVVVR